MTVRLYMNFPEILHIILFFNIKTSILLVIWDAFFSVVKFNNIRLLLNLYDKMYLSL